MTKPVPWTFQEIVDATGARVISGDINRMFSGISIDSRTISADELFVAIRGENHDGHDFVNDAMSNHAAGLLVNEDWAGIYYDKKWWERQVACASVKNTIKALGDLASYNIRRTGISVVAITGSNGKTTTKEMTASVISNRFCTLSTIGNYNNNIGLPLTVFMLAPSHQWAVLELGMNRPKEIENLAGICMPDIGVITNIGLAHLERFDSIDGIIEAKGELLGKVKPKGAIVLNADDPKVMQLAKKTSKRVVFYSIEGNASVKAVSIKEKADGISFTLVLPEESITVNLNVHGRFMVSNGLAAATVGFLLGLNAKEIKKGLEDFTPVDGRMNIKKTRKNIHIIDDTYNANPGSMKAAITALNSLKGDNRGVLVAGDMLELGKHTDSMHRMIGSYAARSGIKRLYITGMFARQVSQGALSEKMNIKDIITGSKNQILDDLIRWVRPGDWVLVKGSRASGMEYIVEGLMDSKN